MQKYIIVRGLPGSGKSTLAKTIRTGIDFSIHLEADMFFVNSAGEYKFDGEEIGEAHRWCQNQTCYMLISSRSVIVSNTFTTIKELRPYFEFGKHAGVVPQVITCQGNFGSIHGVPDDVMKRMRDRFVFDLSPLYKEYFPNEQVAI